MLAENFIGTRDIFSRKGASGLANSVLLKAQKTYNPSIIIGSPTIVQIETTTHCNLECIMCPLGAASKINKNSDPVKKGFHRLEKPKHLKFEDFKKIMGYFPNALEVRLYGIGEPLLNMEIEKMIKYCAERNIWSVLVTNGTLLNREKSRMLIESNLTYLGVSVDGATKETFESIRKGANFEKVIANIEKFIKLRNELGLEFPRIGFLTVRMEKNFGEIEKLREIAQSIGVNELIERDVSSSVSINSSHKKELEKQQLFEKRNREFECNWPWKGIHVNIDGNANPCCYMPNINLGNVLSEGKNVWNTKEYMEFRETMKNGLNKSCNNCGMYNVKDF